jgi:hypothetical protein
MSDLSVAIRSIENGIIWLNNPANVSPAFAGLVATTAVVLGWMHTARKERRKYRIENARDTLFVENEVFQKNILIPAHYLRSWTEFPSYEEMIQSDEGKILNLSISEILTLLEILALDVSTGRASELYVIESQRSLICTIVVCCRTYIHSLRVAKAQKRVYKNLEHLFLRLYFNRYPWFQWFLEFCAGKPLFRYSYLMFRLRYMIAWAFFDLPRDYRAVPFPEIKQRFRTIRHIQQWTFGIIALLTIGAASQYLDWFH